MRILYYSSVDGHHMQLWQKVHILDELRGHGIEIEVFDPERYQSEDEAISALKSVFKGRHFDLFFTLFGKKYITQDLLEELRTLGVPSILFCPDNLLVPYVHLKIAPFFDLVWLTARETQLMFQKSGAKTIFLPYAANPGIYKGNIYEEVNRVLFIGNPYGSRANMINEVAINGINVDLYVGSEKKCHQEKGGLSHGLDRTSAAFNLLRFSVGRRVLLGALKQKICNSSMLKSTPLIHQYPSLSFPEMYEAYAGYAVSLASTAARNTGVLKKPVNVINLRSFEIPASGGIQLCAHSDELAEYFEEEKEIIFYRSHDELIDKARYFTSDRAKVDRKNVRIQARARALRDHSWMKRFEKIFSSLGINWAEVKVAQRK